MLPSVIHTFMALLCHGVGHCVKKWQLFFVQPGQYYRDILLSTNVTHIKHVVGDNFVCQQDSTLVHCVFNKVQLMHCKILNFLSLELDP